MAAAWQPSQALLLTALAAAGEVAGHDWVALRVAGGVEAAGEVIDLGGVDRRSKQAGGRAGEQQ